MRIAGIVARSEFHGIDAHALELLEDIVERHLREQGGKYANSHRELLILWSLIARDQNTPVVAGRCIWYFSLVERRAGDLEIEHDPDFNRRDWLFQRAGMAAMAVTLAAIALGLTGSGPLSRTQAASAGLSGSRRRSARRAMAGFRFGLRAASSSGFAFRKSSPAGRHDGNAGPRFLRLQGAEAAAAGR
jgi:hypothetical protein